MSATRSDGAGDEHAVDAGLARQLAHGILDRGLGDARHLVVVAVVERAHHGHRDPLPFDVAPEHLVDLVDIGRQQRDALGAELLQAGDARR